MDPLVVLRLLLDPDRLAVAGALAATSPRTAAELGEHTGLPRRRVDAALGALCASALVLADERGFRLDVEQLRAAARSLAAAAAEPMDPSIGHGMSDDEQLVLSRFFRGATLTEIPAIRAKRRIVLERLALEFDVGVHYTEREVNERLGAIHPDWATLRRYLVDEGLLDRDGESYWRAGGRT